MLFIVVKWQKNQWGYSTFIDDFKAAVHELDFAMYHGYNAEVWMWDQVDGKWYRIDFVTNDKHVPWAREVG